MIDWVIEVGRFRRNRQQSVGFCVAVSFGNRDYLAMAGDFESLPDPKRIVLNHTRPSWLGSGEIFFITICTQPRGLNQLCKKDVAEVMFETVAHRHENHLWYCRLMLLMPDHLHALVAFPPRRSIKQTISDFKRFTGRRLGLVWQRDFFDNRLRGGEGLQQKAEYIRKNLVRAGLVEDAKDWPFVWKS